MKNFNDGLDSLMERDGESKRYFLSLPRAMKQPVLLQGDRIHSFEDLKGCVDGMLSNGPEGGPGSPGLS